MSARNPSSLIFIREGDKNIKTDFENLLNDGIIEAEIDEQIIFSQLSKDRNAIWSLLLASGYLKVEGIIREHTNDTPVYQLKLTNFEVKRMFEKMIKGWFAESYEFGEFTTAMLKGRVREMNHSIQERCLTT